MAARGEQPTPFFCVLALLFAFLHSVTFGFAASSNWHAKFVDSRRHNLRRPRSAHPTRMCGLESLLSVRLEFSA